MKILPLVEISWRYFGPVVGKLHSALQQLKRDERLALANYKGRKCLSVSVWKLFWGFKFIFKYKQIFWAHFTGRFIMNIKIFQTRRLSVGWSILNYIDIEGNGKICITLGTVCYHCAGRTYSSSYLSLILAYSWSSSVILNTIKISLVRSKETGQLDLALN